MSDRSTFVYRRPQGGRGMVSEDDARFLHDLIVEQRPDVAIELGVAAGCSSVAILDAMATYLDTARGERVWLHAYDIAEYCFFDASRPTGSAVAELTPWHLPRYAFTIGDVLLAANQLKGLTVPFAFIDANHLHPWPAVDLLGLVPLLAPGAWVGLHDIRLPFLSWRRDPRGHGPRHLFDRWPGEKRQGGSDNNIGAIRMPDDLDAVRAIVQPVLDQPWETELPVVVSAALGVTQREVVMVSRPRAIEIIARAARERPIYVCGTGQAGRDLARRLRARHVTIAAFADIDPAGDGTHVDGLPVMARRRLSTASRPRPFMAVSGVFAIEIERELATNGWVRGDDYVVC